MSDGKTPALLSEIRQMAENGQLDKEMVPRLTLALQIDIMEELREVRKELREHTHKDYVTEEVVEAKEKETNEKIKKLNDEIQAWKNRAVGIGIGAAAAGGGVAAILIKIFAPLFTP